MNPQRMLSLKHLYVISFSSTDGETLLSAKYARRRTAPSLLLYAILESMLETNLMIVKMRQLVPVYIFAETTYAGRAWEQKGARVSNMWQTVRI